MFKKTVIAGCITLAVALTGFSAWSATDNFINGDTSTVVEGRHGGGHHGGGNGGGNGPQDGSGPNPDCPWKN